MTGASLTGDPSSLRHIYRLEAAARHARSLPGPIPAEAPTSPHHATHAG